MHCTNGDNFICMGTIPEIAKQQGVTERTVYWWHSPASRRRAKQNKFKKEANRKMLINVEED